MDDFEEPGASKLGHKDAACPDKAAPAEESCPQLEAEVSAITPQPHSIEPSQLHRSGKKKVVLVVLAVVLTAILISVSVWFMLVNNTPQNNINEDVIGTVNGDNNDGSDEGEQPVDKPAPKDEIVKLSVDDELIRKLYKNFDDVLLDTPFSYGLGYSYGFYGSKSPIMSGEMNSMTKLAFAMNAVDRECHEETDQGCLCEIKEPITEYEYLATGELYTCIPDNRVVKKAWEIFGEKTNLRDFPFEKGEGRYSQSRYIGIGGSLFLYSSQNGGFFSVGGRGGGRKYLKTAYSAERDSKRIYVYEVVSIPWHWGCQMMSIDEQKSEDSDCQNLNVDGKKLNIEEELTSENILSYKDNLDKFKWTFTWNGENYIFEKLERI